MKYLLGSLIVVFITLVVSVAQDPLCSTTNHEPYRYFNKRTIYDAVRGELPTRKERPKGCSPIHIIFMARHASRYPAKYVGKIQDKLQMLARKINITGSATLCNQDIQKLKSWRKWYQKYMAVELPRLGYKEMRDIATRFSRLFPDLFAQARRYPKKFRFIATAPFRVLESVNAFKNEVYKGLPYGSLPETEINERLLHYHYFCDRYSVEIDDNSTVLYDVENFMHTSTMQNIIANLAKRLGIPEQDLNADVARNIYLEGCALHQESFGEHGPWCLPFTNEDFEAFEYAGDIEDYTMKSFGYDLNYRQSCGLKNFILSALKNASESKLKRTEVLGHFAFAHSTTIMTLLTEMKLIEDDGPLTSQNFEARRKRSFRTSFFEPGSANLAIILYNCKGLSPGMKLQIFLNEKEMPVPLGRKNTSNLWDLEDALEYYDFYNPSKCNFEKMCALPQEDIFPSYVVCLGLFVYILLASGLLHRILKRYRRTKFFGKFLLPEIV